MNHITPQSGIPTNLKRLPCWNAGSGRALPSLKPTHQRPGAFGNRDLEVRLTVGDVSFYSNYLPEVTDRIGREPQESARPVRGGRTGILERFYLTQLNEHFRFEGRRTWFETIEEMQALLDDYLKGQHTKWRRQG